MSLKGGVAIVTGSSSGIGAACVRMLADKGCNVVINYSRNPDPAEKVAAECRAKGVEAFAAAVPNCKIEYDGGVIGPKK